MEDETDISFLAKFTLESNGYEVLTAGNGQMGLDLLEQSRSIDLIILDIMMPGMDGYQILEKLKTDPDKKDIPVLIFSAMVQEKEIEKGYRLGAIGYIKKPFDAENLVEEVERFFRENNFKETGG